ncbi:MAG: hypothetical protein WCT04_15970 [Planctomycetota bacterium]
MRFVAGAAPEADKSAKPEKPPEPPITWHQAVVPGPAVTLRVNRPMNKSMVYQGAMEREQKSANSYRETNSFYLNALCASQEDGRDQIALWRTYIDRKRSEKLENGKTIERALENANELIDMGPNFAIVGPALRCYAFDKQNRLAFKSMQLITLKDGSYVHGFVLNEDAKRVTIATDDDKIDILRERIARLENMPQPHVCINEAPHYMFPIFPERPVAPGDTWRFRLPTIIPLEQGLAAKILPTQFDLIFNARLREVRETSTGKLAIIDYQISGSFDSALPEFAPRFPEDFQSLNRITHRVSGEGSAQMDVERGWILDRHENFTFNFYGKTNQAPEQKFDKNGRLISEKPRKPLESKAEITSKFDIKLLIPGTRLRSGAVVQSYD